MKFINQRFLDIHNQLVNIRNHPEHYSPKALHLDRITPNYALCQKCLSKKTYIENQAWSKYKYEAYLT